MPGDGWNAFEMSSILIAKYPRWSGKARYEMVFDPI